MSNHKYPELTVQRIHYESLRMRPKMRHAKPNQTSFHKRKYHRSGALYRRETRLVSGPIICCVWVYITRPVLCTCRSSMS
jgi:hypothetical protein